MWLFTTFGFFSVVQKPGETNLTIRSRVRSDLDRLRQKYLPSLGPVVEHGGTDYQYRAKASHTDLAEAMAKMVKDIDYGNFKNAVTQRQGRKRHDAYAGVWDVLADRLPEEN